MGHQKWEYGWCNNMLHSYKNEQWYEHQKINEIGRWERTGSPVECPGEVVPVKAIVGSTYIQAYGSGADHDGEQDAGEIFDNIPEYKKQMIGTRRIEEADKER